MYVWHETNSSREDAVKAITESRIQGIKVACQYDREVAIAYRKSLDQQILDVKHFNEPSPPTVDERVDSIRKLRDAITIPNCEERITIATKGGDDALSSLRGR